MPKLARLDFLAQVSVRGRDDAKSRSQRRVGADRQHFAMIEHAQQFQLQRQRNIGHFVEKQRAAIGLEQKSGAVLAAAEVAPSTCPNNSASAIVGLKRRHIDRQPTGPAVAHCCDGSPWPPALCQRRFRPEASTDASEFAASAMFLKTACIAGDSPNMPSSCFRRGSFLVARHHSQRTFNHGANVGQVERLHYILKCPFRTASIAVFKSPNAVMTMIGAPFKWRPNDSIAVSPSIPGKPNIENQDIGPSAGGQVNSFLGRRRHIHRVPHPAHQPRQAPRDRRFIINN